MKIDTKTLRDEMQYLGFASKKSELQGRLGGVWVWMEQDWSWANYWSSVICIWESIVLFSYFSICLKMCIVNHLSRTRGRSGCPWSGPAPRPCSREVAAARGLLWRGPSTSLAPTPALACSQAFLGLYVAWKYLELVADVYWSFKRASSWFYLLARLFVFLIFAFIFVKYLF